MMVRSGKADAYLNQQQLDEARKLRRDGAKWVELGRRYGVHPKVVRRRIDDDWAQETRMRRWVRGMPGGILPRDERGPPSDDVAARLAEIPEDTRPLTAWLAGDPLPGRSALDQERSR